MHFLFIVPGFLMEVAALMLLMADTSGQTTTFFSVFLPLHTLATAIFSYGMYRGAVRAFFNSPRNWTIIAAVSCFTFSIAGFIAFLLFLIRRRWHGSDVYEEYEKYIYYDFSPEKRFIDPVKLAETAGAELEVSPLVDVLGSEDVKLRRGAISIMNKLPAKDAVRLLKQSLHDRNVEIRFHAASEISRIETDLNEDIATAQNEVSRNPDSPDSRLSLANSYSAYYESGILDEITANYYMGLALSEYYKVLDLGGEDIEVMNYIGNLEVMRKDYEKALSKFKRVCEIDPENIYANVGIIQISFETGKVDEAIAYAKKIIDKMPATKGPMREIISYWAQSS